jgi:uncharacterized membrane-anchored protein YitT (DUF2179 family)
MNNNKKLLNYVYVFAMILIGTFLMSIAINMFLKPYTIAPGGLTGISIVINKLTGISLSVIIISINIPLFLLGFKLLGSKGLLKTALGIVTLTYFLNLTQSLSNVRITDDVLLASISGAILVGISLGIIFKVEGSTGGTDLIGLMLNRFFPNISVPKLMMFVDIMVVILSGVTNKNLETALYSALALYIIVRVADAIIEGFSYSKSFLIISDKSEELSSSIMNTLNRGVTLFEGKGAYTKQKKDVLFVVVGRNEEVALKQLVKTIDNNAFITVSNVHEVLGKGFEPFNV